MRCEFAGKLRMAIAIAASLVAGSPAFAARQEEPNRRAPGAAATHLGKERDTVSAQNVVWDAPGRGPQDSMPLGNGDIALNVWVEAGGDLCFYIAKTDAWSGTGQLLKLGRVRVRLDPPLVREGVRFRQVLGLTEGAIVARATTGTSKQELRVWVDANHPVIHVETNSSEPRRVTAAVELWRNDDVVLPGSPDRLAWYHRNVASNFISRLRAHNLEGLEATCPDPLLHRTFGCIMLGSGLEKDGQDSQELRSPQAVTDMDLQIHVLTARTPTVEAWLEQVNAGLRAYARQAPDEHRREHADWWREFWARSWIHVECSRSTADASPGLITPTGLPLRFGADDKGHNTFRGLLARARVFTRALDEGEIKALAASTDSAPASREGLAGDWRFDRLRDGAVRDVSGADRHAVPKGNMTFEDLAGLRGVRLRGSAWLEVPNDAVLDRPGALTLEAWIAADKLPASGARIIDKSRAGTSEGFLLDTYPGNSLRLILKAGTLSQRTNLPVGKWSHVAATFDPESGAQCLYVNGAPAARKNRGVQEAGAEGELVSRGYTLQRFISACAGRGVYPIKFNGSLFTVDWPEKGSRGQPDYRRWGPDYWWQNTRLPYWPMLAAGDFDMMKPLFRMYMASMPLQKERTKRYFEHGGAYYPETMSFWGISRDGDYGTGKVREGKPISWHVNGYIRREWQGGIELTAMMLDYFDYTHDHEFVKTVLVPFAGEIMAFYDQHYGRGQDGKLRFEPAQALETWWDCVDPMPEIAGLTSVLPRLLALPTDPAAEPRATWQRLLDQLPAIPTTQVAGKTVLAPARRFATKKNCENPELYAVFPYRIYAVGKPDLELARATLAVRRHKMCRGWAQDEVQMAYLGAAEQARASIVQRASRRYGKARFPAFWGPNFDWIPDQDHGGNLLMALQAMLIQCSGREIRLFPAWPRDWDVDFKLHAPHQTTVRGVYRAGKLIELDVTPSSRRADVQVLR